MYELYRQVLDRQSKAVKVFYLAVPGPSGLSLEAADAAVRRLLRELRPSQGLMFPLQFLVAGCCPGLIAPARREPGHRFTGVEGKPVTIARARQLALAAGLCIESGYRCVVAAIGRQRAGSCTQA